MRQSVDDLRQLTITLLRDRGVTLKGAELQADLLIEAELRGLPSHGLQRLPRLLARIEGGLADPVTQGRSVWTRSAFLAVDGERGLGPVVLDGAIRTMAPVARAVGVAVGAVRNANHIGMLAWYVERIALDGLIGVVLTTSEALVHPFGGAEAMLGTNPLAVGVPTGADPFVLDLATSLVSMGQIHHHALTGAPIPSGWAVDAQGRPTTDPEAAKGGAIAPFGGAKGYGLGLAIELLVAALAGSAFAPEVRGTLDQTDVANKGDLIVLIDPAARDLPAEPPGEGADGTAGQAGPAGALAAYLDRLRASRPIDQTRPVAVPGDGMRARRRAALVEGVEVPDRLYEQLTALGRQ